jgi:hypothetical protein
MIVLRCRFDDAFFMSVVDVVKAKGFRAAEKSLLDAGYKDSVVKALLRRVMKRNAW